jgi:isoleucyl-tRNA synthetase
MFEPVTSHVSFPDVELQILRFWQDRRIYEKSLERRRDASPFVFFEGPPTANGMPHPGHCLTRAIKDLFPRYRTMRGYRCLRKAGWDTHGLPVEVEVCKELGIHSKEEIEAYGVEPFIQKCQQSVWRYMREWERLTHRLGFWVDLSDAYVTYHQSYVESVWWCLKDLFDRGLLYQGHKIVWWWAQGGTALSSGEVGQGYRQVADPSVFVRFPLVDDPGTSLVVWTTTPWTLPSNQFVAVHPKLTYAQVEDPQTGSRLIVAAALLESLAQKLKRDLPVVAQWPGSEMLGWRYHPPFDYYYATRGDDQGRLKNGHKEVKSWRVVAGEFVTTDSGTGVVHQAPAFGECDHEVLVAERARFEEAEGPHLICAVGPDGRFTHEAGPYAGRWVKEADADIVRDLKRRGLLLHQEQYLHDYPFCWRAEDDPLIQYPRQSWFIRTTEFKDRMLENNRHIHWLPEHIRDGRFGNFLESNVDWALSRERYWGTPLPIWVCQQTGNMEAIASFAELLAKPGVRGTEVWEAAQADHPDLPADLRVHKPYIDAITYDSPFAAGATMRRVPDVIDCWFDSGAMPFAQWGYPHRGRAEFAAQWPADFISEALDQTRGWFYSLLAISTLMFGADTEGDGGDDGGVKQRGSSTSRGSHPYPHPFRNCIVLGLMLGEDGQKMSKSKRNYREPQEIFDRHGADALRWYFFANQAPWTSIRYSEAAIKDSIPEFLLRLWNVFSFFVIYANIDGFDPGEEVTSNGERIEQVTARELLSASTYRAAGQRAEIDRWILSELNRTLERVVERMDAYDNFGACGDITQYVDALSNWYVRRCRHRFWDDDRRSADKLDAYWTLFECLITTAKMVAPFVPFVAEALWRNLTGVFGGSALESVHHCDYPTCDRRQVDHLLSDQMGLVREIVSLGRQARMGAKLKVRQPLRKVEVILRESTHRAWLESHDALIREELNVKSVEFTDQAEQYISYVVRPNFKRLGPRLGKQLPEVKRLLEASDGGALLCELERTGEVALRLGTGEEVRLTREDVEIRLEAKSGWTAAEGRECVVVLSTDLTPELIREGLARDVVRYIQEARKERNCAYTDRIRVLIETSDEELRRAIRENQEYIASETLASHLEIGPAPNGITYDLGGQEIRVRVMVEKK